jgi:hypothetical protein
MIITRTAETENRQRSTEYWLVMADILQQKTGLKYRGHCDHRLDKSNEILISDGNTIRHYGWPLQTILRETQMRYIHSFKTRMGYNCERQACNLQRPHSTEGRPEKQFFDSHSHFFPRFPHGSLSQESQCVDQLESLNCTIRIYVIYSTAG